MVNKRVVVNLVLLVAVAVSAALLCNYKTFLSNKENEEILGVPVIYNNVFIDNLAVGGLTKAQAVDKLNKEKQDGKYALETISIRTADGSYSRDITTVELGFYHDFESAVEQAYNYGREGTFEERKSVVDELENAGEFITSEYSYDDQAVSELLMSYEGEINDCLVERSEQVDMDRLIDTVLEFLEIDNFDVEIVVPVL